MAPPISDKFDGFREYASLNSLGLPKKLWVEVSDEEDFARAKKFMEERYRNLDSVENAVKTHIHITGQRGHLPPNTPLPGE